MKKYTYGNEYDVYQIFKVDGVWIVEQDGIWSAGRYSTLREAKKAIDNQEIYF